MELTPAEAKLINTLRQIDKENPLGIDGYTEEYHIELCLRMTGGAAAEAGRRYRLFLAESKAQPLIDLTEAQRSKSRWEDTRADPGSKAEYERNHKIWGLPAPIWKTGAPSARSRSRSEREPVKNPRTRSNHGNIE